jgi:hypothetical protein
VLVLLALLPLASAKQDKKDPDRVRAKEPTTVTVYGEQERVKTNEAEQDRRKSSGALGGLKNAASKTWNGIVGFGGWLLNVDDDIPSERERRSRSEPGRHEK